MKNTILLTTFAVLLGACSNTNNLCGVYRGILPAADGPGIEMTISLNKNNLFKNKLVYIGKDNNTFYETGTYRMNNGIIELNANDDISYYRQEPGQLRLLDYEKQEITGALADFYVLKKVSPCQE